MKNKTVKTNKRNKIVYLIPTYNEKDNIVEMLKVVKKTLNSLKKYKYNILVVDDNSPDGTGELVKKYSVNNPQVVLLSGKKKGLGKAMARGYLYAMGKLNADIVISNESDFSYDPTKSVTMIKKIEDGFDVVLGSRKLENINKWPLIRRIIHFVANTVFASIVAGVTEVEDHNSAFKAIRVKGVLDRLNFKEFPVGFSFFNYLTYKLSTLTTKIYEFKTTFRPRTKGVSKMMMRDSLEYMKNCFKIRSEKIFKILK
jgi:dolichol-phosphate mannosyltransferase